MKVQIHMYNDSHDSPVVILMTEHVHNVLAHQSESCQVM